MMVLERRETRTIMNWEEIQTAVIAVKHKCRRPSKFAQSQSNFSAPEKVMQNKTSDTPKSYGEEHAEGGLTA